MNEWCRYNIIAITVCGKRSIIPIPVKPIARQWGAPRAAPAGALLAWLGRNTWVPPKLPKSLPHVFWSWLSSAPLGWRGLSAPQSYIYSVLSIPKQRISGTRFGYPSLLIEVMGNFVYDASSKRSQKVILHTLLSSPVSKKATLVNFSNLSGISPGGRWVSLSRVVYVPKLAIVSIYSIEMLTKFSFLPRSWYEWKLYDLYLRTLQRQ